ncbi:MAG: TraR/DksA family transcriptional regulator [Candidatus Aminicenantes bacterium]|nr:TraR/DksA family transcriptional regulator [Candidatus Aminicenantes bacterium]
MTKKEKQAYRKTLLEQKEKIVKKLSQFYNESKEVETDIAQDVVDKAESSYTKEFLLSLSHAERKQLLLIDDALRRLETPDFGLCQMCGQKIGKKRLDALPWTPYCINCQQKKEEEVG